MRTRRIELEGSAGHVVIERQRGSATIRIDSILREPRGKQAWMTWEIPSRTGDDEFHKIAEIVQRRCDGVRGTNSDIHAYLREIRRVAD